MEATRVLPMTALALCIVQVVVSIVPPVCDAHQWTEPVPMTEVNSKYDDKSPFLSFDGLTLYFSVEPGWGYTRTSIRRCVRVPPVPLPRSGRSAL